MRLSILICSIVGRENELNTLITRLNEQKTDDVEILVEKDNKEITTGEKRNILLKKSCGDYIAFIDDDDIVSKNYISKILNATKTNPDCCGMEGLVTFKKNGITRKFIHSIKYNHWFMKNNIYYRCPNHLSPIKRNLAIQIGFPNKTVGEDRDYSDRLFSLLHTEEYIKNPIYFYNAE